MDKRVSPEGSIIQEIHRILTEVYGILFLVGVIPPGTIG